MHTGSPDGAVGPPNEAVRSIPKNCIPNSDNSNCFRVNDVNKNQQLSDILQMRR
jgi:hypothetical protein